MHCKEDKVWHAVEADGRKSGLLQGYLVWKDVAGELRGSVSVFGRDADLEVLKEYNVCYVLLLHVSTQYPVCLLLSPLRAVPGHILATLWRKREENKGHEAEMSLCRPPMSRVDHLALAGGRQRSKRVRAFVQTTAS